jgi:hypothetical protein
MRYKQQMPGLTETEQRTAQHLQTKPFKPYPVSLAKTLHVYGKEGMEINFLVTPKPEDVLPLKCEIYIPMPWTDF